MNKEALFPLLAILVLLSGCAISPQGDTYDPATEAPKVKSNKPVDLRELPVDAGWFSEPGEDNRIDLTREYAKASHVYSVAAFDVYERDAALFEPIPFPETEAWNPALAPKEVPSKGFYAKSWIRVDRHEKRELVIVYRGTSGEWQDWLYGNLVFWPGEHQYSLALEYALLAVEKFPSVDEIILTGHSLGGGLAQYVQRYIEGSRAVVFSASPNKGRFLSGFYWNSTSDTRSLRTFEHGEILQYLRWPLDPDFGNNGDPLALGKQTRWIDTYDGSLGIFSQHSIHDTSLGLIKIAATVNDCEALNIIQQLENRRREYLGEPYYQLHCNRCYRKRLRALGSNGSVKSFCDLEQ